MSRAPGGVFFPRCAGPNIFRPGGSTSQWGGPLRNVPLRLPPLLTTNFFPGDANNLVGFPQRLPPRKGSTPSKRLSGTPLMCGPICCFKGPRHSPRVYSEFALSETLSETFRSPCESFQMKNIFFGKEPFRQVRFRFLSAGGYSPKRMLQPFLTRPANPRNGPPRFRGPPFALNPNYDPSERSPERPLPKIRDPRRGFP